MEWITTIGEITEVLIIVGLVLWNTRLSKRIEKLEKDTQCTK